jgi:hypothetical protein
MLSLVQIGSSVLELCENTPQQFQLYSIIFKSHSTLHITPTVETASLN